MEHKGKCKSDTYRRRGSEIWLKDIGVERYIAKPGIKIYLNKIWLLLLSLIFYYETK